MQSCFWALPAEGEPVRVVPLELSGERPGELKVGDRLDFRVTGVKRTEGMKIELALKDARAAGQWALLIKDSEDLEFTAVPAKAGTLILGPLEIKDSAGAVVAGTEPVQFDVVSAIDPEDKKPEQPEDIRPPVGLGFPWWIVIISAFITLLLAAAVVFAVVRWSARRKGAKLPEMPKAPPKPEDEEALAALSALELKGLLRGGGHKLHYFAVSEILKRYFGRRFGFDALESTTSELILRLDDGMHATDKILDRVEMLFSRLDRVKFTDHVPPDEEGAAVINEARKLVTDTRRVPLHAV